MKGTNLILAEKSLALYFNLIITSVNRYGEERNKTIKNMKRKDFLEQSKEFDYVVKIVDKYPTEELKDNWLYIKKNGRTAWLKERE